MKKLNKKGFILVETLIVTVFVVTLFIVIYQATVPALGELEQQNKYDDIDSVYYSNLYKQMLTRYGNITVIDAYLQDTNNKYYMDISDCDGKVGEAYIYNNRDYCKMLQENLEIGENDKVIITDYDITNFKQTVRTEDMFDSGALSNFRDYINTVSNVERFYGRKKDTEDLAGKYRLFLVRNITENDSSVTKRYANIGIYSGTNEKYIQGELVHFKVNNSTELPFYVLKNSRSTDTTVTLIAANNITTATPYFNCTGKFVVPDQEHSPLVPAYRTNVPMDSTCPSTLARIKGEIGTLNPSTDTGSYTNPTALEYAPDSVDNTNTLLTTLRDATATWTNANPITEDYISIYNRKNDDGTETPITEYTIDYGNYASGKSDYARLLDANDIFEIMGCSEDSTNCFDKNSAQAINLNPDIVSWLYNDTTETTGYWTASSVPGSNLYGWTIVSGRVVPTRISDNVNMGVRPVIVVNKNSNLRRG